MIIINFVLDKQKNMIPDPDKDNFCSLYLDKADEILHNLCTPNVKLGEYKRVNELIPAEYKEYFRPDYHLSKLLENHIRKLNNQEIISYDDYIAMNFQKNIKQRG